MNALYCFPTPKGTFTEKRRKNKKTGFSNLVASFPQCRAGRAPWARAGETGQPQAPPAPGPPTGNPRYSGYAGHMARCSPSYI
jgi:hypothetical protein